ncbi:ferredoxin [Mycobacterium senriense]|uniref:Ferredoxin n=3 Tax=Mycobacterium TaxID=1763 RepID=D5P5S9_9MYCO|nr:MULTISPECIES: ferredoxin [Mycobacterium]AFJ34643.1 ferredoxin reductase [Mycobacterium sp. MOTT36Y]AFS12149.1 3Fe-4S ferredoxin [Mycobacterium intracellulare subsp. intracellulare MTCC 9506]EFG78571.1 ferredoxin [Mycobacterium parascrofulaceum ATCC BAA-614]QWY63580.1 ferredoxin [Mycobacterium avium subsp. hominissuis]WSE51388.1 ferredoxin [Mycobacterium sp. 2-64]
MKVKVDTTKCSGIGLCEVTAPSVFEIGDDGQAHAIKSEPAQGERAEVEEAVNNCPTGALSIDE